MSTKKPSQINTTKSPVRAKMDHSFRMLKRLFGFDKVRSRGIKKYHLSLYACFALVNLCLFAGTDDRLQDLMNRAQAAQQASNYDEASAAYREILKLRPGWAPAEFNLGMMYFLEKNYPVALNFFNSSLQHDQPVVAAYLFRGISYFNTGQNEKALKSLIKYRELQPNDEHIHLFLAGTYFSLGDYGPAIASYLRQIALTPADESLYYRLGECYLSLAREELKRLNETEHGKYFVWLIAAEAHAREGGYPAAAPFITKALKLDSASPEAFIIQGQLQLSGHLASEARESFSEAWKRDPKSCRAVEGMFESELALGDTDQAVAFLTKATDIGGMCLGDPLVPNLGLSADDYTQRINSLRESSNSTTSRKLVQLEIDRLERARTGLPGAQVCGSGVSATAHDVDFTLSRARCLEGQGNLREASQTVLAIAGREQIDPGVIYRLFRLYMRFSQQSVAKLSELSPDSAYLTFMNAQVMEQQGKPQQAESEYLKAISRPDAGPEVLVAYARFVCTQNRLDEAIPFLNKALQLNPLDQSANALLGQIYFEQNRSEAAVKPLQTAVRLAPGEDQSRVALANSLRRMGRVPEAIAILEAAPSDPSGRIHYILSQCYRDVGRTDDSKRALQVFKERNGSAISSDSTLSH